MFERVATVVGRYIVVMPKTSVNPQGPRSALVTGAAGGIGRAIAAELVRNGYLVAVTDLDPEKARRTAEQIGATDAFALDVTDEQSNRDAARRVSTLAPLGAWVCNAGVLTEGPFTEQSGAQIRRQSDVNILGVAWGVRAATEVMRAQRVGSADIGIVASLSAHSPVPDLAMYAATKAAALSLASSLSAELRGGGIRVHAVCPDGVETQMVADMDPAGEARAALAAGIMLSPEKVASELVGMFGTRRVYKTLPAWRGLMARSAALAPSAMLRADRVNRQIGRWRLRRSGRF